LAGLRPAPLRPLGVGEILDGAVRLVHRNVRSVFVVSVPYAIVATMATALLQYGAIESQNVATLTALGGFVLTAGLGAVLSGFLAPLYSSDLLGTAIDAGTAVSRVGRRAWSLFFLGLVVIVCEAAGIAACFAGGVWLWGVWAVAAPALVLERLGMRAALGRSLALVRGTFWRVWGIRALGWLLVAVLGQLVTLPFQLVAGLIWNTDPLDTSVDVGNPALYVAVLSIGQLLVAALLAPVSAAIELLLYTDLRMRKEGMDIVLAMPPQAAVPTTKPVPGW
jgi:hypothetical protein